MPISPRLRLFLKSSSTVRRKRAGPWSSSWRGRPACASSAGRICSAARSSPATPSPSRRLRVSSCIWKAASRCWKAKLPRCVPLCTTFTSNSACHNPNTTNSTTVLIMKAALETPVMDLAFTPEEQKFREEVRAWVRANLPAEISHKVHNALRLTRDDLQRWARILGKKGWLGYGWPKQFGGPGWSAIQKHLFEEECALAGAPRVVPFGPVMVAPVSMAFGNPEQQQRFLPGIASGEVWWSQGYSEPGSGSDLASVKTRAERKGDKYIVNGQKTWTTLGQYGDWMFNLARTSTEGKPQTGISFLRLDMTSKGVTVRPIQLLDGECEVNEVFFDNAEGPADQLIGEENK